MNIKGVTKRKHGSYRARVTIGGTCLSKDFNLNAYTSIEVLREAVSIWLADSRESLKHKATGVTSKYKTKVNTIEMTQAVLKQYLTYNLKTGYFTWLQVEANSINVGDIAGCLDSDLYIVITLLGKVYKAHRLAFLYMEGVLPEKDIEIDHSNRIPWDNAWDNLRKATRGQNQQNAVKPLSRTGIKGLTVTQDGLRYRTAVTSDGISYVKEFSIFAREEALLYLQNLRETLHKEFART